MGWSAVNDWEDAIAMTRWHPPIWRTLVGLRRYAVSDAGQVRNGRGVMATRLNEEGYPKLKLVGDDGRRRDYFVHALVARAFLGPRPVGHLVRHRNDDRADPRAVNLRYGTHADNHADKVAAGRASHGARRKLTRSQVRDLRRAPPRRAARLRQRFGISISHAREIRNGRKWAA